MSRKSFIAKIGYSYHLNMTESILPHLNKPSKSTVNFFNNIAKILNTNLIMNFGRYNRCLPNNLDIITNLLNLNKLKIYKAFWFNLFVGLLQKRTIRVIQ